MTVTTIEEAFQRADALGAILTIAYRPLADPPLAYLAVVEPMDLPSFSDTAPTWQEAASTALSAYDPVPEEEPVP